MSASLRRSNKQTRTYISSEQVCVVHLWAIQCIIIVAEKVRESIIRTLDPYYKGGGLFWQYCNTQK